jgi:hypothetical protein
VRRKMSAEYGTQKDFIGSVEASANARQLAIEKALKEAFSRHIERREVEVVIFSGMTGSDLSEAIFSKPEVLKPLLASCNIAARAIERDLGIKNLDTYAPRLSRDQAGIIAGYMKQFLPAYLELPTLAQIDRVYFIDSEIRKLKGAWEKNILAALNEYSETEFHKRTFRADSEEFEVDAATPPQGDITIGIDVKRIEARRDIHKRCDEIVNKARKLRTVYPNSKFGVVVYYPFIEEHVNVQNRLRSPDIDGVVFASESDDSITNAVRMLLSTLKQ